MDEKCDQMNRGDCMLEAALARLDSDGDGDGAGTGIIPAIEVCDRGASRVDGPFPLLFVFSVASGTWPRYWGTVATTSFCTWNKLFVAS